MPPATRDRHHGQQGVHTCQQNPRLRQHHLDSEQPEDQRRADGREPEIEQAGERLYRIVLDIASGTMTRTETIEYQDSLQMYLLDPML